MPPTIPRRAFVVFSAIASPPGTANVAISGRSVTSPTAARIIARGTGLIAGAPTASPMPGLVIVPTPAPARSSVEVLAGARRRPLHLGGHRSAVGAVGIVARVLHDHTPVRQLALDGKTHAPPGRQADLDLGGGRATHQSDRGRLGGGARTRAGGPPGAQALRARRDIGREVGLPRGGLRAHAGRPTVDSGRDRRRNMCANCGA